MKLVKRAVTGKWVDYREGVRFKIRPFPLSRMVSSGDGAGIDAFKTGKEQFIAGVEDWEGLEDANGKPLPCTDGNKAFLYDYCYMVLGLPEDLIGFVMTEIQKMMRPVEEIEKNSSTSRTGMQEESSSTAPPAEKSS